MGQTIDSWLAGHAAHQPGKTALIFEGEKWTYAELHAWVDQMAAGLVANLGLKRGDRVAYLGHNSAEEVALFFAAARVGLMVVPLNWRLAAEELRYITQNAEVSAFFYGVGMAEVAQEVAADLPVPATLLDPDTLGADPGSVEVPAAGLSDPLLIVYTSGTTGRPKGAVHTQEAVFWNALISCHAHDLSAKDRVLCVLPLFHVGGINIQMMPCFYAGGTVDLLPVFEPGEVIDALENGTTVALVVPTIMRALAAHPRWAAAKLPDVRLLAIGSTDVPVDILEAVHQRDIPIVQVYGATETGPVTTYQRAEESQSTVGSIGRPGLHVQVRVVDSNGQNCPPATPGEVWVKAPNLFTEYWKNPEATTQALSDGWFKTGDVAMWDDQGLLWFVGRLKHVIISGGENIYPAEIERVLQTLDGLAEVAVVGREDQRWGQIPVIVAAVQPGGPSREALLAACDGKIARFKHPKDVVFVKNLPRNALGKVVFEEVTKLANVIEA